VGICDIPRLIVTALFVGIPAVLLALVAFLACLPCYCIAGLSGGRRGAREAAQGTVMTCGVFVIMIYSVGIGLPLTLAMLVACCPCAFVYLVSTLVASRQR
jgi:hypothetical protein